MREHHTLAEMLDALNAPRAALVVMDRGIATEDRVQWLREQGYRYLVVSRERTRHFDAVRIGPRAQAPRTPRRCAYTASERAAKERGMRTRSPSSPKGCQTAIASTRSGSALVGSRRTAAVAQHYAVELDTDETGQRATAVRFTRHPVAGTMMTHPGVYCLRSNETGWDEATLWRSYFTLTALA